MLFDMVSTVHKTVSTKSRTSRHSRHSVVPQRSGKKSRDSQQSGNTSSEAPSFETETRQNFLVNHVLFKRFPRSCLILLLVMALASGFQSFYFSLLHPQNIMFLIVKRYFDAKKKNSNMQALLSIARTFPTCSW